MSPSNLSTLVKQQVNTFSVTTLCLLNGKNYFYFIFSDQAEKLNHQMQLNVCISQLRHVCLKGSAGITQESLGLKSKIKQQFTSVHEKISKSLQTPMLISLI